MNEVKKNTLVRISESDYQKIENEMEKENRSFSYLVSQAVTEYAKTLNEPQTSKPKKRK